MRGATGARLRAWAEKDGRGYPDWAYRYLPLLRTLRKRGLRLDDLRILEAGANENGFARFAGVSVIAADVSRAHLRAARDVQPVKPVAADIASLPFAHASFDLCVCVDTFEHLSSKGRLKALEELVGLLKPQGTAIITFPSGEGASEAEAAIRREYEEYTGRTLRWLEEHKETGLPEAETLCQFARNIAGPSRSIRVEKNTPLWLWKWSWRILMCGWPGRGNSAAQAMLRILTPLLSRCHWGECYRAIVWIEPKKAPHNHQA
ncbi:MAG: methyltransferase domain-containing protein [Candidatus Hydrogenedentes bacterium]|nr:methyltransferase domain-containing protein [Candidatus Hydrogenedentota bacterium]